MNTTTVSARYCVRCEDCLAIGFVELARQPFGKVADCALCGGPVESMGRVAGKRLRRDEVECACDARCTSARGPSCSCVCRGENHGTGATVDVSYDAGPVPRYRFTCDQEKARGEAEMYRAALAEARSHIARLPQWSSFIRNSIGGDIARARDMRTHKGRNDALGRIGAAVTRWLASQGVRP